jgi:hypothetical protein
MISKRNVVASASVFFTSTLSAVVCGCAPSAIPIAAAVAIAASGGGGGGGGGGCNGFGGNGACPTIEETANFDDSCAAAQWIGCLAPNNCVALHGTASDVFDRSDVFTFKSTGPLLVQFVLSAIEPPPVDLDLFLYEHPSCLFVGGWNDVENPEIGSFSVSAGAVEFDLQVFAFSGTTEYMLTLLTFPFSAIADVSGKPAMLSAVSSAPCISCGSVMGADELPVNVLRINGSSGDADYTVSIAEGSSLSVELDPSPNGPRAGRYVLWIWPGATSHPTPLVARGSAVGWTINPTPLSQGQPQPFCSLRGRSVPGGASAGTRDLPAPPFTPWSANVPRISRRAAAFMIQGLVEDAGANNPTGSSVTNAIVLEVR